MNGMVQFVPIVILAAVLAVSTTTSKAREHAPQQTTRADASSIAGRWTSRVHASTLSFDLKVDGQKVTGTFSTDQSGSLPLTGDYVDGRLSFTVAAPSGEIGFTGRLKDNDTLVGDLSTQKGDMACTATRVKEK